ncbi:helix-turn-helix domain-containing protein [Merdimonas faecis]
MYFLEVLLTMDILNKITRLRMERGWSEYQLAEKSGLTQSTISSWYRRNMLPSIPSLERICEAYGITLSQFFLEKDDNTLQITDQQRRLLEYAAKLEPKQYEALINFLNTL